MKSLEKESPQPLDCKWPGGEGRVDHLDVWMPPDILRWSRDWTLGQMFAGRPLSWKLTPALFGSAMATLDRLNLFKVDAFVVGSSEMCKTWCHLEIFTWLQSSSLYLCKPGVNDWRKKTIQPLSKNPSQLWCCFQLKGRGVAFWGEVETPGWRQNQNQEKLISNLPE